jgi:predicted dehydrogenase
MLARAPINTVVIATPHSLHAEQAIAAARAGKAIISEKPMAVTLEDGAAILAAIRRHGVPYTVVHNFLFTPAVQGAAALLRAGTAGQPLLGRGEIMANKSEETTRPDRDWRASKAAGGGALIDSSYHEIYTVETLMGSPVASVEARLATLKFPIDVDDTALMTFEHANGRLSNVAASWCARSATHRGRWVWINGTQGGVRVVYNDAAPLAAWPPGANRWETVDPTSLPDVPSPIAADASGHAAFLLAAFRALDTGATLPIAPEQAFHNLAIIDAARRASAERRAVQVAAAP